MEERSAKKLTAFKMAPCDGSLIVGVCGVGGVAGVRRVLGVVVGTSCFLGVVVVLGLGCDAVCAAALLSSLLLRLAGWVLPMVP